MKSIVMSRIGVGLWRSIITLLIIGLSTLINKWLFQRTVGWYLGRKATARRKSILTRVAAEASEYHLSAGPSPKSEDVEWEKVEKPKEGEADDEWDGIIGFFHPFWFVIAMGR